MATTSSYQVMVGVSVDATDMVTGTDQAEAALVDLAATTNTQTDAMNADLATVGDGLATTIPAAADTAAVGLTTKASKFKAVGADLGTELAAGVTEGITGGDAVGGLTSALTGASGLLAVTAATGIGAAAAIGVGLGTSLIGGLVSAAREEGERVQAKFDAVFEGLELSAKTTAREIKDQIASALTFESTVNELGADRLTGIAETFGVELRTVVELINGEMTPAAVALKAQITDIKNEEIDTVDWYKQDVAIRNAQIEGAGQLLELHQENKQVAKDTLEVGKQGVKYYQDTGREIDSNTASQVNLNNKIDVMTDRLKDSRTDMAATADAAERLADAVARTADQLSRITTRALNGLSF